jgi:F-type H+-transporting ATPase subunit epsilon
MADKLHFDLVSPEKRVMSADVDRVTVPGTEGQFGVYASHAPVMSALRPGMVEILDEGNIKRVFVRGGFVEVNQDGMTVLAEEAIAEEDLKAEDLAQKIKDAEEDVTDASEDTVRQKAQEHLDQLKEVQAALGS